MMLSVFSLIQELRLNVSGVSMSRVRLEVVGFGWVSTSRGYTCLSRFFF